MTKPKSRQVRKRRMRTHGEKRQADIRSQFFGLKSVSKLFAWCVTRATTELRASDLGELERAGKELTALSWLSADQVASIDRFFADLAARPSGRWGMNGSQRQKLLGMIGGTEALTDPRPLFCVAVSIDAQYGADADGSAVTKEIDALPPPGLFADATNLPPPIGQMTALAVCRRWFSHIWPRYSVEALTAFGRLPTPIRADLPESIRLRLEDARDRRCLRFALVGWRRHSAPELVFDPGCRPSSFAVSGLARAARANLMSDLLQALRTREVDVALLPELALGPDEYCELVARLRATPRRFPTLVATGLVHRRDGEGHVNQVVVLDSAGRELFRHTKLEPFHAPGLGLEDILPQNAGAYAFLDTPVGRVVANVCRDIRSDIPMVLNRLLEPAMLLVPSYSRKLDFAMEEAAVLGQRHGATTLAMNPPGAVDDAFAVYAPIRGCRGGFRRQWKSLPAGGDVVMQVLDLGLDPGRLAVVRGHGQVVL